MRSRGHLSERTPRQKMAHELREALFILRHIERHRTPYQWREARESVIRLIEGVRKMLENGTLCL